MRALNRKLVRDLVRVRGQVLAIAVIVASGVAVLVMSLVALASLDETSRAYYERYRFAHVFAACERAPERLARRLAEIPGVQAVDTRIGGFATLDVAGFAEPVIGRLVSIPDGGQPVLNRLAVRAGRLPAPDRPDEVVLGEPFADAHGLSPGNRIDAVVHGHERTLEVVGTALSPEFVYALGPGALLPDDRRFGVLWMGRDALEAAFDLEGAFNEVSFALLHGTPPGPVVARVDRLLERYGGTGAHPRSEQTSHWFLHNDLEQLRTTAHVLPAIFLAVAVALTHMMLARLIATERAEIGLLKAFGHGSVAIGWHYAKMALAMTSVGVLLGWALGAWLGAANTRLYADFYRFPFLSVRMRPDAFGLAAGVSLAGGLVGSLGAVRRAVALPPAEAMRPPAPPVYRRTWIGGTHAARWLDQPTRIIVRQIARWPLRSALTSLGVGLAVGVLVMTYQWMDSLDRLVDDVFFRSQRQDVTVSLVEPRGRDVLHAFERLPGVMAVEPMRSVPVDFRNGRRRHRGAIEGVARDATLRLVYDAGGARVRMPPEGLVLSGALADKLAVGAGDTVRVEVREGRRPRRDVPVVGLFETDMGLPALMDGHALDRLLLEPPRADAARLLVDEAEQPRLFAELKDVPAVSAVAVRRAAVDAFHDTIGETLLVYIGFFAAFAGALAFGVVYNGARIALSERGRELATLRVLGFSRLEISAILLGEMALLVLVALPLGCLLGSGLSRAMNALFETELYRLPLVIEPATYGLSVLVVLLATVLSAALVRRRVDRLDLIAVLKTRE